MTQAVSGTISGISGLFGMFDGMAQSKAGPGIAPYYSLVSGREQQAAANEEARLIGRQSDFAYEQSLQDAAQKDYQVRQYKEEQALRFASNGVTLQGSPLGVLFETQAVGDQESAAIRRRGVEQSGLLSAQGLQMLRRGTAAGFGGYAQSLQQIFDSQMQSASLKSQALQTGFRGATAFVSGFGAAKGTT